MPGIEDKIQIFGNTTFNRLAVSVIKCFYDTTVARVTEVLLESADNSLADLVRKTSLTKTQVSCPIIIYDWNFLISDWKVLPTSDIAVAAILKNSTNQKYSCPRDYCLSALWGLIEPPPETRRTITIPSY